MEQTLVSTLIIDFSEIANNENKCENACYFKELTKQEYCFNIDRWFKCKHYQCQRTTVVLNRCIVCKEKERIKFFPKRCGPCGALIDEKRQNFCNLELCKGNYCFYQLDEQLDKYYVE